MKLLSVFIFLLSVKGYANPNVGDYAVLAGDHNGATMSIRSEYTEFTGDVMIKTNLVTVGANTHVETEEVAADDIVTRQTLQMMMALCEGLLGGVKEVVKTPAGEFEACKIQGELSKAAGLSFRFEKSDQAWVWLAEIPVVGAVKVESNGMNFYLQEYGWAN